FRTQVHQQTLLLGRTHPHQQLVLRVIEQLAELLEAVILPVEIRMLFLHPTGQFFGGSTVVDLDAMGFEHVAQDGERLLGPDAGLHAVRAPVTRGPPAASPAPDRAEPDGDAAAVVVPAVPADHAELAAPRVEQPAAPAAAIATAAALSAAIRAPAEVRSAAIR